MAMRHPFESRLTRGAAPLSTIVVASMHATDRVLEVDSR
jgi:hypothetical protein